MQSANVRGAVAEIGVVLGVRGFEPPSHLVQVDHLMGDCRKQRREMAMSAAGYSECLAVAVAKCGPVAQDGELDLAGISWAIAGGESGPQARPMNRDWVRRIRDQCHAADVAFFFKQWGGIRPKSGGNSLDGRKWLEYPTGAPIV